MRARYWKAYAGLIGLALAGCATVRPLGHDTYVSDAVRPVLAADKFCRNHGQRAEPMGSAGHYGEFVFKCVAP